MQQKFKPFPTTPGENILGAPSLLLPSLVGNPGVVNSALLEITPTQDQRWIVSALNLAVYVRYQQSARVVAKAGFAALEIARGRMSLAAAKAPAESRERYEAEALLEGYEKELGEYGQQQARELLAQPVFALNYRLERQGGEVVGIGSVSGDTIQIEQLSQEKPKETETFSFIGRTLVAEQILQLQSPVTVFPGEALRLSLIVRGLSESTTGTTTWANVASLAVPFAAVTFEPVDRNGSPTG